MGRKRILIFDLEEKVMLMTMKEILEVRRCLRDASAALTEIEKVLDNEMTILGIPGQGIEENFEPEIEHVGYDDEQCARNK